MRDGLFIQDVAVTSREGRVSRNDDVKEASEQAVESRPARDV